jgi:hypothetical protein
MTVAKCRTIVEAIIAGAAVIDSRTWLTVNVNPTAGGRIAEDSIARTQTSSSSDSLSANRLFKAEHKRLSMGHKSPVDAATSL